MSILSDKALEISRAELAAGVRGGQSGWGRFRGTRVDEYLKSVGLQPDPREPTSHGWPWCAAFVFWCFRGATVKLLDPLSNVQVVNRCPRTASALHLWGNSPHACQTQQESVGSVFVLDRGEGKGHTGIISRVRDGGLVDSIEGDTSNKLEDATGDAVGEHLAWDLRNRHGFTYVGCLTF